MAFFKHALVVRILQSVMGWGLLPLTLSSAQITLDGSVGPKGTLQGPNFTIDAKVGSRVGTNLFHSFGKFNVQTGESATFTGPDTIRNVIGRVTGGQASQIDGTLRSEMPNAALYLLNPAGVMFGPNATLDVPGSFHVSTADYLKLSDGGRFAATQPETSVLTSAPPQAFGFLGPNPAPITIQGSTLQVAKEQTLSIVGGDVTMAGGNLKAPEGQATVVSVGSAGEISVPTVATTEPVTLSGFTRMGKLELKQGASIGKNKEQGGGIELVGGQIMLREVSALVSETYGAKAGRGIRVRGSESITIRDSTSNQDSDKSRVSTKTFAAGAAGPISVVAPQILLDNRASIRSGAKPGSTGRAGDVEVRGQQIKVRHGGEIVSQTEEDGDAGTVRVEGSEEVIVGGSTSKGRNSNIISDTFGEGNAGKVVVQAPHVLVDEDGQIGARAQRDKGMTGAGADRKGNAGEVEVTGQQIEVLNGGTIASTTFTAGAGGTVTVQASEAVTLRGKNGQGNTRSSINSDTWGKGDAGKVVVEAPKIIVNEDGRIATRAREGSTGHGGDVEVSGQQIQLVNGGTITSSTFGPGDAGTVKVEASEQVTLQGRDKLKNPSAIISEANGEGAAGTITVQAPHVTVDERGSIAARANKGSRGRGGDVEVRGQQIEVRHGAEIVSQTSGPGDAGTVRVEASKEIVVGGNDSRGRNSNITSDTFGEGNAGKVVVQAPHVAVDEDGIIAARAQVDKVTGAGKDRRGNAGDVEVTGQRIDVLKGGVITSTTLTAGAGGTVRVQASEAVTLRGRDGEGKTRSNILSDTLGRGNAGKVVVQAPKIIVDEDGRIAARALAGSMGRGGDIEVSGQEIQVVHGGEISSSTLGEGDAGAVTVQGTESVMVQGFNSQGSASVISSDTVNGGTAGKVVVQAPQITVNEGGVITARALKDSTGRGGNVEVSGRQIAVVNGGQIASSTLGTGDAGTVTVRGTETVTLRGRDSQGNLSTIASDTSGAGAAGAVTVEAPQVVVDEGGVIAARAITGSTGRGGDVEVRGQEIAVINGGETTSDTAGAGAAGKVIVEAPQIKVDSGSIEARALAGSTGHGGDVEVSGQQINVLNGGRVASDTEGAGDAGTVTVRATERVKVQGRDAQGSASIISSDTASAGAAGTVTVQAPQVVVDGGGVIAARALQDSTGRGGNVEVSGQQVTVINGGEITSDTAGAGAAGKVIVQAPQIKVNGGFIEARALADSTGRGGDVEVSGQQVEVANGGTISSATFGAGDAGQIRVNADTLQIAGQDTQRKGSSIVASTETAGRGGDVNIRARTLLLNTNGEISATSTGSGDAGRLTVAVDDTLRMTDGRISTQADQAGGGNITVKVGGVLEMVRSELATNVLKVPTQAQQPGGGIITMQVGSVLEMVRSKLTTSVQGGSGNAGDIKVTAPAVALNDSTVQAKADAGKGGNITINAEVFIASPDSIVDASAGPAGVNGTVDIRGVINDLSGSLKPLSQEYQSAVVLAANRCAGRVREGEVSSFVLTGRGGIPLQPGGLLPSTSLVLNTLSRTAGDAGGFPLAQEARAGEIAQLQWEVGWDCK